MAVPHSTQNLPPSDAVPHEGHWRPWTGDPHSGQNFALAGSTASHTKHPFTCRHPAIDRHVQPEVHGRRYYWASVADMNVSELLHGQPLR
jgi:hypothetical protein